MSSLTAMTYLPISACKLAAPCSARQISVRAMPGANCTNTILRKFESGSCMTTRRTPLIASVSRKCDEIARLVGDALHHARFARRHFAQDRNPDRLALMRDRGDLHRHIVVFERDMAVALAERAFRLQQFRIDQSLDDEFGVGRHVEIDGDAPSPCGSARRRARRQPPSRRNRSAAFAAR